MTKISSKKHISFYTKFEADKDDILSVCTIQAHIFSLLTEALKDILSDLTLEFTKDGIVLKAVDKRKKNETQSLVFLKLNSEKFDFFYCEETISIGIEMSIFHKILKGLTNEDILFFSISKKDKGNLKIKIFNQQEKITKEYKLSLKDIDLEKNFDSSILDFTDNIIININTTKFKVLCKEMLNISDIVELNYYNNELIFEVNDLSIHGTQIINLIDNPVAQLIKDYPGIIQGIFNLKHLFKYTKFSNLSNIMELEFANDKALKITFSCGDLGYISLLTAPYNT